MRWPPPICHSRGGSVQAACERKAEVEKTIKGEGLVGSQLQPVSGHAPTRVGPISAMGAVLHYLIHPRTRKEFAARNTRRNRADEKAGARSHHVRVPHGRRNHRRPFVVSRQPECP